MAGQCEQADQLENEGEDTRGSGMIMHMIYVTGQCGQADQQENKWEDTKGSGTVQHGMDG